MHIGVQAHVIERVFNRVERRGEIVIAGRHQHLHVRILGHGVSQQAGGIAEAVLHTVIPGLDAAAGVIVHVGLVVQFVADVAGEDGGEGRRDLRAGRIELAGLADVQRRRAREAAVIAADGFVLIAQQLPREVGNVPAEIALFDVMGVQAGIADQFVDDGFAFGRRKLVAFVERQRIFAGREVLRLPSGTTSDLSSADRRRPSCDTRRRPHKWAVPVHRPDRRCGSRWFPDSAWCRSG